MGKWNAGSDGASICAAGNAVHAYSRITGHVIEIALNSSILISEKV